MHTAVNRFFGVILEFFFHFRNHCQLFCHMQKMGPVKGAAYSPKHVDLLSSCVAVALACTRKGDAWTLLDPYPLRECTSSCGQSTNTIILLCYYMTIQISSDHYNVRVCYSLTSIRYKPSSIVQCQMDTALFRNQKIHFLPQRRIFPLSLTILITLSSLFLFLHLIIFLSSSLLCYDRDS